MININSSNTHVADNQDKVNTQQYLKNGFLRCNSKIFLITYKQPLTYLENKYAI